MKRCGLTLVAVLLAAAPPASGYSPPRYGGAATAPLPERALTWDPVAMTRPGEWQLAHLVYDGLTRFTAPAGGATRTSPRSSASPVPRAGRCSSGSAPG